MNENMSQRIIVGVESEQEDAVIGQAASLARRMGAGLVFAWADPSRERIEQLDDGSETSRPIDPDVPETSMPVFPPELASRLTALMEPTALRWETRLLSGAPAQALGELAEKLDALMIVVGARRGSARATIEEFFNRSVAAQLSHRQHRPVLIVPVNPVSLGAPPREAS